MTETQCHPTTPDFFSIELRAAADLTPNAGSAQRTPLTSSVSLSLLPATEQRQRLSSRNLHHRSLLSRQRSSHAGGCAYKSNPARNLILADNTSADRHIWIFSTTIAIHSSVSVLHAACEKLFVIAFYRQPLTINSTDVKP